MIITEKRVRKLISKSNLPGVEAAVNPYIGCSHACAYCYAVYMSKYSGHDSDRWGSYVDVKLNASETISARDAAHRKLFFGTVTDPYQPAEKRYEITRSILERLLFFPCEISIITKSSLVTRDIDLFRQFENISVGLSVNTTDDRFSAAFEPGADPASLRIDALRRLKEAGIDTFCFASPVFPVVFDPEDLISSTCDFVDFYYFEHLKIRSGNRAAMFDIADKCYPQLSAVFRDLAYAPDKKIFAPIKEQIERVCLKYGANYKLFFR